MIGLIELGGSWDYADLQAFCARAPGMPVPQVIEHQAGGAPTARGEHPDWDLEVALDIQIAAVSYFQATGQPAIIHLFWAAQIAEGIRAATQQPCDVCSISWGNLEPDLNGETGAVMENSAKAGTDAGMVIFAAAGDRDASDGVNSALGVELPASCPHVIACGGTTKTLGNETVWNENPGDVNGIGTGGGFSKIFNRPDWQPTWAGQTGRMVPDIAANADPGTGYLIVAGGNPIQVGGTSAVAPLYAGLFAAFGKRLGWIGQRLWQASGCFRDITLGDNGAYQACQGPDPCTGLGSPIGIRLAQQFRIG